MKSKFFRNLAFFTLPVLCSSQLEAQDDVSLFDLPLEELLRVKVVSKTEENISLSPGIASVYYPEQLHQMGLNSVADFLRFATSIEFNYSVGGTNPLQIRGLSDANNQKILFLVDSIPYWMPSHGDIPINGIPLVAIEKIEVIRGPASVIYGTNSSSGVINIITKSNESNLINTYASSQGVRRAGLYHSLDFLNGHFDFSLEARSDNGFAAVALNTLDAFDPGCMCFPLATPAEINKSSEYAALLARYTSGALQVSVQKYQEDLSAITNGTILSPTNYQQFGTLITANYQINHEQFETNLYSDWNRFYWHRDVNGILAFNGIPGDGSLGFDDNGSANYRWRTGLNMTYSLAENQSWLFGIEHETRSTEDNKFRDEEEGEVLEIITQPPFNLPFQIQPDGSILLIDKGEVKETAILTQYDHSSTNWRLVAGFRFVDNEFSGSHLSPRLSYIYSLSDKDSLKVLFSEGFNSPTFRQITARNSFGIPQDVDVKAETVETTELSYTRSANNINQTINLFYTRGEDLIQSSFSGISNSDQVIKRSGAEYEIQIKNDEFTFISGLSYLAQGNQAIENDATSLFNSRWLVKAGIIYQWQGQKLGFSLRSASKRAEVDEYFLLDANYQLEYQNWRLNFGINNLLDEQVFFPDVRNQQAVIFQGEPERVISLGFDYEF